MEKGSRSFNRLINETSTYLLQHAYDPVDWYPWGTEAREVAKAENRPIFLSLGYASCHWCHEIQRETFSNAKIAARMNEIFINILVDREELPEIDGLYMEFAQCLMTGAGGWPLNVILTPDLHPFFAITYLPPFSQEGMMGMIDLIDRIEEVWYGEEKEALITRAERIVEIFVRAPQIKSKRVPSREAIDRALEVFYKILDPVYGGIKNVPKFPLSYQSILLMRCSYLRKESRALFAVEKTLDMMQRGGIYDHIGGGFSRYVSDEMWCIPHFEKMLYDNALLLEAYLDAWRITGKKSYAETSGEIADYVLRDMVDSEGGLYSAQDSDTNGKEGLFYTWTIDEIRDVLGSKASFFMDLFGVTERGNFAGRNVLYMKFGLEEYAERKNISLANLRVEIEEAKRKLFLARQKRKEPAKDKIILSSWNGLMINSLVEAGLAFNNRKYLEAASRAAEFIRRKMWMGSVLYRDCGQISLKRRAGLDEYAFLIRGLLTLFEAGEGNKWLLWVFDLLRRLLADFVAEKGGFYQTDGKDQNLIVRRIIFADGAEPSGNALLCESLLRLSRLTQDSAYQEEAKKILRAVKPLLDIYSPGYEYHIMNLLRYYDKKSPLFVLALNDREDNLTDIQNIIYSKFIPHRGVIIKRKNDRLQADLLPWLGNYESLDGQTTLYRCRSGICSEPLVDLARIREVI